MLLVGEDLIEGVSLHSISTWHYTIAHGGKVLFIDVV
jgi:hypothetical protein